MEITTHLIGSGIIDRCLELNWTFVHRRSRTGKNWPRNLWRSWRLLSWTRPRLRSEKLLFWSYALWFINVAFPLTFYLTLKWVRLFSFFLLIVFLIAILIIFHLIFYSSYSGDHRCVQIQYGDGHFPHRSPQHRPVRVPGHRPHRLQKGDNFWNLKDYFFSLRRYKNDMMVKMLFSGQFWVAL